MSKLTVIHNSAAAATKTMSTAELGGSNKRCCGCIEFHDDILMDYNSILLAIFIPQ